MSEEVRTAETHQLCLYRYLKIGGEICYHKAVFHAVNFRKSTLYYFCDEFEHHPEGKDVDDFHHIGSACGLSESKWRRSKDGVEGCCFIEWGDDLKQLTESKELQTS